MDENIRLITHHTPCLSNDYQFRIKLPIEIGLDIYYNIGRGNGAVNIRVSLLGGFEASSDEGTALVFDTDKDRALFIYMVSNTGHAIRRESLAGLFWPEKSETAAHHSLAQAVYSLHRSLTPDQFDHLFEVTPSNISIQLRLEDRFDFHIFNRLANGCQQHWTNPQYACPECRVNLEQACDLYHGDFCAGLSLKECDRFEEWLRLQREIFSLKHIQLLDRLILGCSQAGKEQRALNYAYLRVYEDPYDENSQLVLIRLLLRMGWRSKAIKQYKEFHRLLEMEIGFQHAAETLIRLEELFS